jgi:hypothetical protein
MVLFEQRGERRGKIGADDYSGIEFACKYGAKRGKLCTPKAFRRARCVRLFIIMGSDVTAVSAVCCCSALVYVHALRLHLMTRKKVVRRRRRALHLICLHICVCVLPLSTRSRAGN